jgi:hypothetical protein
MKSEGLPDFKILVEGCAYEGKRPMATCTKVQKVTYKLTGPPRHLKCDDCKQKFDNDAWVHFNGVWLKQGDGCPVCGRGYLVNQ